MNMQALMRQAQSLQKDILKVQEEIEKTTFEGENGLVKVKINGKKDLLSVNIDRNASLTNEDLELIEDMLLVAINNANKKVDNHKEQKMARFGNIPGLF